MNRGLVARELSYMAERRTLLQDVSLQLRAGELTLLIGPNGAGKSTLIHLLSGALVPTCGSIELDGRDIRGIGAESLARLRALVSQAQPTPFPFPVSEVVALGRACSRPRESSSETRRHVRHALFITGSSHLERRDFSTLSGGERQKVVFARALVQLSGAAVPTWLLLDEPTSGLDVKEQDRLFEAARAFAACGNGVLAIAHDWSLAARHADRIIVLETGRVRATGRPDLVFSSGVVDEVFGVATRIVDSIHGSENPLVPVVMEGGGIDRVNRPGPERGAALQNGAVAYEGGKREEFVSRWTRFGAF
jgi:iron complex transport system ATP-binding protein